MHSGLAAGHDPPQSPPQPSEPQDLPVQSGVQLEHVPEVQSWSPVQAVPQVPQLSLSLPRATQVLLQQESPFTQVPGQVPPQPSLSPQCLPVQTGTQIVSVVVSAVASVVTTAPPSEETSLAVSGLAAGPSMPGPIGVSMPGASATPASGPITGPTSTATAGPSTARSGVATGPSGGTTGPSSLTRGPSIGVTGASSLTAGPSSLTAGPSTAGRVSVATEAASWLPLLLLPQPAITSGVANNKSASERCTSLVIFLFLSFRPRDAEMHHSVGILHAKGFFATHQTREPACLFSNVVSNATHMLPSATRPSPGKRLESAR